mgnify:CR=1 FL=1
MSEIQIGTAKYLALYFLKNEYDFEERNQLIHNLCLLYNKHEIATVREFDEVATEIKELKLKTILTEDEEYRLDYLDDWIVENAYKYRTEKNALAQALIIVISKYLDSKVQGAFGIYHYKKQFPVKKKKERRDVVNFESKGLSIGLRVYKIREVDQEESWKLKCTLYDLGGKIDGVSWARGVLAASNYIRHHQEWDYPEYERREINGKKCFLKKDVKIEDITGHAKYNVETLFNLGFPVPEIVKSNQDISFRFADKLELGSKEKTLQMITSWIEALEKHLKSKFLDL